MNTSLVIMATPSFNEGLYHHHIIGVVHFAIPVDNMPDDVIAEYIEKQTHLERARDDDFSVEP